MALAVWPPDRPTAAQARISDNSFLIEEAYNQERGVVQHISTWQRSLRSAAWLFTFTQEWPLGTQQHQLSYTIPLQRLESPSRRTGFADAALNYRYQLAPARGRVATAPRFSVLVPTGSATRGLGAGTVGAQVNLPLSVRLGSSLVSHWNAGLTVLSRTTTYNLGASAIWLARPNVNLMCELLWTRDNSGGEAVALNPGIRWAHNFASGLQVVPGVAVPLGIGSARGKQAVFLYLSFEHRFRPETAQHLVPQGPVNSNTGPP